MDYLVVEGYKEAAENFAREAGMDPQADFESIQTRMTIRNAIQQGDIEDAIERVNDLNPEVSCYKCVCATSPLPRFAMIQQQCTTLSCAQTISFSTWCGLQLG